MEPIIEFRAGGESGQTIPVIGDPKQASALMGTVEPGWRDVVVNDVGVIRAATRLGGGSLNVGQQPGLVQGRKTYLYGSGSSDDRRVRAAAPFCPGAIIDSDVRAGKAR